MDSEAESEWLTEEQAARWLNVTVRTLRDNARRGRIPSLKVTGRLRRFHKPTLIALAQPKQPARK
jgi:excisionase family DNA binding protein